ncbi:MAG: hypothetical protein HYZ00_12745, partial [Candidatus Hydrogenedentes bacterium]|nr:hypothetical protein [Candidatus Hydrogenedentota bacterium]
AVYFFDGEAGGGGEAEAGGEEGAVKVHLFELIESTYPVEAVGRFACSDPKLDKIWEISARTLKLCMEDTFTDCPLYEQTHWVGDARKEALFGFTAFGAGDLAKRCIRLTGLSLEEDYPITLSQTPSCWGTLIPAWSFLWGMSVWDYYEYSGDEAFLREVWPMVMQNLRGTEQFITDHGLFSGPFWNFFDWSGIDDSHRTVLHNSMLLVGAIDAARKCAAVVQDAEASHSLAARRATLVASINALYDQGRGGYPDSIHEDGTLSEQQSVHNNFLALLYDIAPVEWRAQLRQNVLDPPEGMVRVGSPGALFYQHLALEQFGQQDTIITSIYENYQPMLDAGATTVWESFASGTTGSGGFPTRSHCHAWSSGPIHFLNRIVLGILPEGVGGTSFVISPRPSGLAWAKGATASVRGPVEVEWTLEGKTLTIAARAPAGVKLAFKGNAAIAGHAVVFNGETVN